MSNEFEASRNDGRRRLPQAAETAEGSLLSQAATILRGGLRKWAPQRLRGRHRAPTIADDRVVENRRLLDQEIQSGAVELRSQPTTLILEPATACNLKCPFCPTGAGYLDLKKQLLGPADFARIIDHLDVDFLEEVLLYNWGEPLLNPNLSEYILYFAQRGKRTEISINFSTKEYDASFFDQLVASGLSRAIVSIDGASQEAYERYRVGGNLDRVLANVAGLASARERAGRGEMEIYYKMLLHRYNEHEVEAASRLAEQIGVEFLLDEKFWCPDEHRTEWAARGPSDSGDTDDPEATPVDASRSALGSPEDEGISTFCRQLWDTVVVNANGAILPCCLIYRQEHAVGNLVDQDLSEIRNNSQMKTLRAYVTGQLHDAPGFSNHCETCTSRWCTVRPEPAST